MRVVSLLPSATELLAFIGGADLLVGRSHECDYPLSITHLPVLTNQKTSASTSAEIDKQVRSALEESRVGEVAPDRSLYELDIESLKHLRPDVILTQDLCEVCSIDLNTVRNIARTMSPEPEIISLDPATLDDVFDDLLRVGEAVNMSTAASHAMIALREHYWAALEYVNVYVEGPEIAFLEWMDPLFIAGHWTPGLIRAAGGRHSLNEPGARSRQIDPETLLEAMPDRLVICPCGYDLKTINRELDALKSQKWWHLLPAVSEKRVVAVDGNQMFNRPGPRLVDALYWLVGWINDRPEIIPEKFPVENVVC